MSVPQPTLIDHDDRLSINAVADADRASVITTVREDGEWAIVSAVHLDV